jgi:hypothetical protein
MNLWIISTTASHSSLIIQIANDQTANDKQKKLTAKQNKQRSTHKVVVVKKNNEQDLSR